MQLQPVFDFATVDETRPGGYNWGYDPLNYNVPEGSYSTDPWHGEVRVRECRAMVAALHRAGLGVVMDVVYNHTYYTDNWMERAVPGYCLRRWPDGSLTNGSGCGCDLGQRARDGAQIHGGIRSSTGPRPTTSTASASTLWPCTMSRR